MKNEKLKIKKTKKTKISPKLKKIIEEVSKLSVIELADLVKSLEEKFGVSAVPAPVAVASTPGESLAGGGATPGESAQTEKSKFNVVLASGGANKIAVIKAVRELKQDLGLKEAKDLVEAAPKELLTDVKKEEAEAAKKKIETAGGQVELK